MKAKIYPFEEHKIAPQHIDSHAYYIIKKLKSKGFEAYLVGGGVRDLLLKQVPKDFDISTSAKPEEIRKIFNNCILIGRRFRLAHIRFGRKIIEVATFRSGDAASEELITHDNEWGSPQEDALRRDFTINGLFYDVEDSTIIDYVGGMEDAKKKTLNTIGEATLRFRQDPVRMIRLLKFKARFDFAIEEKTLKALKKSKNEIMKSSQARILEELSRMLQSGASAKFFKLLEESGLLALLLPKISEHLKTSTSILRLLHEADAFILKHGKESLEKGTLFTLLVFTLIENRLKEMAQTEKVHLGIIMGKAKEIINQTFSPFFLLSRNLKAAMISIIVNQFRFTPLHTKSYKKIHLPHDPFFSLAFQFFHLRSSLNKEFIPIYTQWHEAYVNYQKKHPHLEDRTNRRPRRRRKG